ncbi:Uncharacterized protein TCM_021096 isoform 2, partial [Theobroma cacao]
KFIKSLSKLYWVIELLLVGSCFVPVCRERNKTK